MVVTNAFGMEINVPDVRIVIHAGFLISCPIKNQILYFSIHSIKYTVLQYIHTVLQYTCAKNRIKTVCKIYCNTVYLIRYNSILYTVVQNTVYFYNLHTEIQY